MIQLTRLSGSTFLLNSDLIERVDRTPDTVITLVDGTKYVVCEGLDDVARAVRLFRGEVVALGSVLSVTELLVDEADEVPLAAVRPLGGLAPGPAPGPAPTVPPRPREA